MKRNYIGFIVAAALCLVALAGGFVLFSTTKTPTSQASEDTFSIRASKDTVKKDKTFTLTVDISARQELQNVQATITYDADFVEYVSSDDAIAGCDGTLTLNDTFAEPTLEKKYQIRFRAVQLGECDFHLENANYALYSDLSTVKKGAVTEHITIVENPAEEDDSTLSELLIGQGDFEEEWDSDTFDYTIVVPKDTKELTYSATPSAKDAVVESDGPAQLKEDDNRYTITVTAPSGAQSIYTITVLFE